MRNDSLVGGVGRVGIQRDDQRQPDKCADELSGDEPRRRAGGDPGEGVREHATDGDRRVGVGSSGTAIGLDMTDEMLACARDNAAAAGITNVEFRKGLHRGHPAARPKHRRR